MVQHHIESNRIVKEALQSMEQPMQSTPASLTKAAEFDGALTVAQCSDTVLQR